MRLFTVPILLVMFFGCGGDVPEIAELTIQSDDIFDGVLPVINDMGTLVQVMAVDASGKEISDKDLSWLEWASSDESVLDTKSLGGLAMIKGRRDIFDDLPEDAEQADIDAASEPEAVLTVQSGMAEDSIPVQVVMNGSGMWHIVLNGTDEMDLELTQSGRRIFHETFGAEGTIVGNLMTLSQFGYVLEGRFVSRTRVEGTYTEPNGSQGTWTADK